MLLGPANRDDQQGQKDVEVIVRAAGDVAVSAIEQGDHVLSPVAIEAACDELVNDDCSVVRALHGTLLDFAVPVESGRDAWDSKIPVVREEEAKFHVCRQI